MSITATEFKMNFGKYLLLCQTEDIYMGCNVVAERYAILLLLT